MRRLKLASAVVLLIAVSGVLSVGQPDPGRESGATAVAPGVTVEALRAPAGPWQIRVIRIDRATSPARLLTALGRGELRGRERLSGIIDRESARAQVIAGVNADFFRMSGPYAGGVSGPCVRDGELVTTPRGRPGFYVTADGRPRVETTRTTGTVSVGERSWPVDGTNMPDQGGEGAVQLHTAVGGWQLTEGCVAARLEGGPLRTTGQWTASVIEVIAPGTARGRGG
ncbi:MAG: hypothetical protein ACOX9R_05855 [Armatimonadota bacterium]|jgi:hypothetical protein